MRGHPHVTDLRTLQFPIPAECYFKDPLWSLPEPTGNLAAYTSESEDAASLSSTTNNTGENKSITYQQEIIAAVVEELKKKHPSNITNISPAELKSKSKKQDKTTTGFKTNEKLIFQIKIGEKSHSVEIKSGAIFLEHEKQYYCSKEQPVGAGGEGKTYKLVSGTGKKLALKTLKSATPLTDAKAANKRNHHFLSFTADKETRPPLLAAQLPNGTTEYSILKSYHSGRSLRQLFNSGAPLSTADKLILAAAICDAFNKYHKNGTENSIRHNDIKPENILIKRRADGAFSVVIIDPDMVTLDESDVGGGTPPYIAPEKINAELREGDRPFQYSDVYSLGLVLYELFFGPIPSSAIPYRPGNIQNAGFPEIHQTFSPAITDPNVLACLLGLPDMPGISDISLSLSLAESLRTIITGLTQTKPSDRTKNIDLIIQQLTQNCSAIYQILDTNAQDTHLTLKKKASKNKGKEKQPTQKDYAHNFIKKYLENQLSEITVNHTTYDTLIADYTYFIQTISKLPVNQRSDALQKIHDSYMALHTSENITGSQTSQISYNLLSGICTAIPYYIEKDTLHNNALLFFSLTVYWDLTLPDNHPLKFQVLNTMIAHLNPLKTSTPILKSRDILRQTEFNSLEKLQENLISHFKTLLQQALQALTDIQPQYASKYPPGILTNPTLRGVAALEGTFLRIKSITTLLEMLYRSSTYQLSNNEHPAYIQLPERIASHANTLLGDQSIEATTLVKTKLFQDILQFKLLTKFADLRSKTDRFFWSLLILKLIKYALDPTPSNYQSAKTLCEYIKLRYQNLISENPVWGRHLPYNSLKDFYTKFVLENTAISSTQPSPPSPSYRYPSTPPKEGLPGSQAHNTNSPSSTASLPSAHSSFGNYMPGEPGARRLLKNGEPRSASQHPETFNYFLPVGFSTFVASTISTKILSSTHSYCNTNTAFASVFTAIALALSTLDCYLIGYNYHHPEPRAHIPDHFSSLTDIFNLNTAKLDFEHFALDLQYFIEVFFQINDPFEATTVLVVITMLIWGLASTCCACGYKGKNSSTDIEDKEDIENPNPLVSPRIALFAGQHSVESNEATESSLLARGCCSFFRCCRDHEQTSNPDSNLMPDEGFSPSVSVFDNDARYDSPSTSPRTTNTNSIDGLISPGSPWGQQEDPYSTIYSNPTSSLWRPWPWGGSDPDPFDKTSYESGLTCTLL